MENYFIFDMIGEGSFGKVYKGQRKGSNQIVAIKKIFKKGKKEKELKNLRQEIEILRKLYHENIIQLLDSFETNNEFYLVTELAQGQLFEILEEDKHMPETEIKKIAIQLVSALFYLHSNHIIHRDIKPQNVLIGSNGVIKLCDFGFARAIDSKTMITSIKGTPLYMAPELLQEYPYNQSADLWSLGVILYELFVGQPPFYTNNFTTLMNKIIKENVKYSDSMSKDFKDFLKGLLIKNPRDRFDWQKILDHPYMRETETEKNSRTVRQDNYQKWILRLKNEKVFNLFESDQYIAKFSNLAEVENGTKGFVEFDNNNIIEKTKSGEGKKVDKKNSNTYLNEDFWLDIESKANTEELATSLRRDINFADKINIAFKNLITEDKERITDKKLVCLIVKIIFSVLTKGKIDNQNIDITKNQNILNHALSIFKISQSEDLQILLNDIIKVIGLFAKFSCYYSNGIDINFCSGFLKYFPAILQSSKPSNIHINLVKAVGIMITAANMMPRRSLIFYKTILDLSIINVLVLILKSHKTYTHLLVRSCCECLAILINPMNGDIYNFPMLRFSQLENYEDFKTFFGYLDTIKKAFLTIFLEHNLAQVFPVIFDNETDISLKIAILRISLQLFEFAPKEMSSILKTFNSPFVAMLNNIFNIEEIEQKLLIQLGLLLLIKIVKYAAQSKININEFGFDFAKPTSFINKFFSTDFVTISLSFGLIAELLNHSSVGNQFIVVNGRFFKSIKEICKLVQGKGRDENKKLEGTNFGFHRYGILDYPFIYLEKLYKSSSKDKFKTEFIQALTEIQFDEVLIDLLSNISYKSDISPRGISSILVLIYELISSDYKNLLKRLIKDNIIKILLTLIKEKQYLAISDWPSYKREEGCAIAQNILTYALKLLKIGSEVNAINEEVVRTDFFLNLKNSYKYITKENYILPISIIFNLVNEKANNDDIVNSLTTDCFIQYQNISFIDQYMILKDYSNKDLIIETLLLLSSLCRKNEKVYPCIHDLNIYSSLKYLLEHSDSSIKSRVCNLVGNMCRHSDYFYDLILKNGIIGPLIQCCYDTDKNTRKFACFAIGNAAFLTDKLYEHLKPCIPILVGLLEDVEDNTRANSAGALGNFVRCSDVLCSDINNHNAPEALLSLAEREQTSNQTIKVALFALGNFCNHNIIKNQLEQFGFKNRIESIRMRFKGESSLLDLVDRIKKKLT